MIRTKPTEQIYSNYTKEDFKVWKTLYEMQLKQLKPLVSEVFLTALEEVNFSADRIPDFSEVNSILQSITGWQLKVVSSLTPQDVFFKSLSQKTFTATCWLRTMEQLNYIEEPDMFHDVFAHVPLLSNKAYCNFFKGISDIALEHISNPLAIELLGRIYWFTIEFGLKKENGRLKIYGAGIISSSGETKNCLRPESKKLDFDVRRIFKTSFRTNAMQENYFVVDSFEQLYNSLPEIRYFLEKEISLQKTIR